MDSQITRVVKPRRFRSSMPGALSPMTSSTCAGKHSHQLLVMQSKIADYELAALRYSRSSKPASELCMSAELLTQETQQPLGSSAPRLAAVGQILGSVLGSAWSTCTGQWLLSCSCPLPGDNQAMHKQELWRRFAQAARSQC